MMPLEYFGVAVDQSSLYDMPALYDQLAQLSAPQDIEFYLKYAGRTGSPVLELGCGTGRVTVALARAGFHVVGIDLSQPMLLLAREKVLAEGLPVKLFQGDFRDFDLGARFRMILLPYNALNHVLDLAGFKALMSAVSAHLDEDGLFIIDTFQPALDFLARDRGQPMQVLDYIDPQFGGVVRMSETSRYDPLSQINHVTWHYEADGQAVRDAQHLAMRIYYPQELNALLTLCGFEILGKFGDYDEGAFVAESGKQLMVCRHRPGH